MYCTASLSLSLTLSHSLTLSLSLTHSHSLSHSLTHTNKINETFRTLARSRYPEDMCFYFLASARIQFYWTREEETTVAPIHSELECLVFRAFASTTLLLFIKWAKQLKCTRSEKWLQRSKFPTFLTPSQHLALIWVMNRCGTYQVLI